MEIVRTTRGDHLELAVEGRLDGYWAQHVATSVGDVMREGTHAVRINLSKTSYISSAGIGVLVDLYKQFEAVSGSFRVIEPSKQVQKVLELVGLAAMLTGAAPMPGAAAAAAPAPALQVERREIAGAVFEFHHTLADARMSCRVLGRPELLAGAGFAAADCRELTAPADRMALGLGALGEGFDASRDRFGEFLAVAGAAACQPTDGTNYPDYMVGSGAFVPHLSALYGIACDGDFGRLVRFENGPLPLSAVAQACLDAAGAKTAAIVLLAESAGLVGATLKRSPAAKPGRVFEYPEIRQWLSFSAERCHSHSLALIAGIVSSAPAAELKPFVRPMAKDGGVLAGVWAHLHAAAFAYRPLQKGAIEMKSTVRGLFEGGGLQGVLHLLADDREIVGAGESELLRGACWVGAVETVSRGDEPQ